MATREQQNEALDTLKRHGFAVGAFMTWGLESRLAVARRLAELERERDAWKDDAIGTERRAEVVALRDEARTLRAERDAAQRERDAAERRACDLYGESLGAIDRITTLRADLAHARAEVERLRAVVGMARCHGIDEMAEEWADERGTDDEVAAAREFRTALATLDGKEKE